MCEAKSPGELYQDLQDVGKTCQPVVLIKLVHLKGLMLLKVVWTHRTLTLRFYLFWGFFLVSFIIVIVVV